MSAFAGRNLDSHTRRIGRLRLCQDARGKGRHGPEERSTENCPVTHSDLSGSSDLNVRLSNCHNNEMPYIVLSTQRIPCRAQTVTVTRRKVAGIDVPPLTVLVF